MFNNWPLLRYCLWTDLPGEELDGTIVEEPSGKFVYTLLQCFFIKKGMNLEVFFIFNTGYLRSLIMN